MIHNVQAIATEGQKANLITDYVLRVKFILSKPSLITMYSLQYFVLKFSYFFAMHLQILGLEICADTIVGNAMLRGISGGQKKRVTTGKANKISILKNEAYHDH